MNDDLKNMRLEYEAICEKIEQLNERAFELEKEMAVLTHKED